MPIVRNPVIRGFAPDPSIIRVGDWYYIAVSSFEWFPNIPLFRSKNLATWEHCGSVTSAVPGQSLLGVPDSGGIWAPALSYADGLYWVTYAVVRSVSRRQYDLSVYVCTAREISGPWSEPIRVPGYGFDPSLYHQDGKVWLLNLINDTRVGGRRFDGIVATELFPEFSTDGRLNAVDASETTHLLLQRDELIEGPKITHKEGWYYLLCAQGGTSFKHAVLVARSRDLLGPYEVDETPLITTRDNPRWPLQRAGHGELVQSPTGGWYLSFLASRPLALHAGLRSTLGRETAIAPITWVAGWPKLAGGGWQPPVEFEVTEANAPSATSDDAAANLQAESKEPDFRVAPGWPWSTLREPAGDWITADGLGSVSIRGRLGPESLWEQSLIAQRLTEHQVSVAVTVIAEPTTFSQSAGLIIYYNTSAYVQLHVTWTQPAGEPLRGQQWRGAGRRVLVLEQGRPDGAVIIDTVDIPDGPVRLGAHTVDGVGRFYFFIPSGCTGNGIMGIDIEAPDDATDVRHYIGGEVDLTELSDEVGNSSRFTGTFAGVNVIDLVNGTFTAQFSDWSLQQSENSLPEDGR